MTETASAPPGINDREYTRYTLMFVYACIVYSIIGFSWGAVMGGVPVLRMYVDTAPHGHLILLAHGHINLLGWVEMAIFGCYLLFHSAPGQSADLQSAAGQGAFLDTQHRARRHGRSVHACGRHRRLRSGRQVERTVSHLMAASALSARWFCWRTSSGDTTSTRPVKAIPMSLMPRA